MLLCTDPESGGERGETSSTTWLSQTTLLTHDQLLVMVIVCKQILLVYALVVTKITDIACAIYRHPEHSCRPTFLNLLKTLSRGSSELLAWSKGDGSLEAGLDKTVGAPLEAGKNLYLELQLSYTYV